MGGQISVFYFTSQPLNLVQHILIYCKAYDYCYLQQQKLESAYAVSLNTKINLNDDKCIGKSNNNIENINDR